MSERELNVGLVGASGALGGELLRLFRETGFPIGELRLFGGAGSAGDVHEVDGTHHVVRPFDAARLEGLDVAIVATPADVARRVVSQIVERGVMVIDASAAHRQDDDVPLVLAPINRSRLEEHTGLVAVPDALSVALALVLAPLAAGASLREVEATALLSASATGRSGMDELSGQVLAILNQRPFSVERFPRQMAFNAFPATGQGEVVAELARLVPDVPGATFLNAVRVPLFSGLAISLRVEADDPWDPDRLGAALAAAPGLRVADEGELPDTLEATEADAVLVAAPVVDPRAPKRAQLWLTLDNLCIAGRTVLLALEALRDDELI